MINKLLNYLILCCVTLGVSECALARYCNNPQCQMCNRIFGPMPGYELTVNYRAIRVSTPKIAISSVKTTNSTPVSTSGERLVQRTIRQPYTVRVKYCNGRTCWYRNETRYRDVVITESAKVTESKVTEKPTPVPVQPSSKTSSAEDELVLEPTPMLAVEAMLSVLGLNENSMLYDLGCGDGRYLIEASSEYGCKSVGIELNPETVELARSKIQEIGLEDKATVIQGDIRKFYYVDADVVVMYLFPGLMEEVVHRIPRGTKVLSYQHPIPGMANRKFDVELEDEENTTYTFYTAVKY